MSPTLKPRSLLMVTALSACALGVVACRDDASEPDQLEAAFTWDYDDTQTEGTNCSLTMVRLIDESTGNPSTLKWTLPDGTVLTDPSPVIETPIGEVTLTVTKGSISDSVSHAVTFRHC